MTPTDSPTSPELSRRNFLRFLGRGGAAVAAASLLRPLGLAEASPASRPTSRRTETGLPFTPLKPTSQDELVLADGFHYKILASWGDSINSSGDTFGYNNDYTRFLPLKGQDSNNGLLWVNHESTHPLFVGGRTFSQRPTREQVIKEQYSVGGSILRVQRKNQEAPWEVVHNHRLNRRLHARTPIPFVAPRPIAGKRVALGTLANCSGGQTPWGSILTCEENYDEFYNEIVTNQGKRTYRDPVSYFGWETQFPMPPEHYGWVVEINPLTGQAKKLTALGRFAHEAATVVQANDGRCVVYMGDDSKNQCIYKFIAARPGTLEEGELFVADIARGRWVSLDIQKHAVLKKQYKDQTDVLIHARPAAHLVGGTPMDRPEDIEVDPKTKHVYVSLTNNKSKGNYFGSILKLEEENNDFLAMQFKASTFLPGGPKSGFACPDNLSFDRAGNLWVMTDISSSALNQYPYRPYGNNGLFYIPLRGPQAGKAFQIASAPVDAELTGLSFSNDGSTLFLSVQGVGSRSRSLKDTSSHWPSGGANTPKPSVVTIQGPALKALMGQS